MLYKKLENKEKFTEFFNDVVEIKRLYSQRKYSNAVNKIMSMTDKANQYINENKPWAMKDLSKVQEISTQGLNYFRSIIILLGPVMPDLLKKTENMLNENNLAWENCLSQLLDKKIEKFTPLKTRIQKEDIQRLNNELNEKNNEDKKNVKNMSNEIEYEDFSKINLRVGKI